MCRDGSAETLPTGVRVHCDGTQFDMRCQAETFSSHCHQLSRRRVPEADIAAKFYRPECERAGSCDVGEGEHLGNVVAFQRNDPPLKITWRLQTRSVKDHLNDRARAYRLPALRCRLVAWPEQPGLHSGREIPGEIGIGRWRRLGDRRKWRNISPIMTRLAAAYSEIYVRSDKGMPDWVIEGAHGHDQFRPKVIGHGLARDHSAMLAGIGRRPLLSGSMRGFDRAEKAASMARTECQTAPINPSILSSDRRRYGFSTRGPRPFALANRLTSVGDLL